MMAQIDDGGPAFPPNAGWRDDDPAAHGMSLRDWFAGQALQGLLALYGTPLNPGDYATEVEQAFRYADAMLGFRKLNNPKEEPA